MTTTEDSTNATPKVDSTSLQKEFDVLEALGAKFAQQLESAFEGVVFKGKKVSDVLRDIGRELAKLAVKAAMKPLEGIFEQIGNSILSSGIPSVAGGVPGPSVGAAKGAVISQPTTFAIGAGQVGLMGERGAEAIMPLARGADGSLGIRASGGGGVNVTFNISTPDADSFRRSQTQIAALLTRAVWQGQRNL